MGRVEWSGTVSRSVLDIPSIIDEDGMRAWVDEVIRTSQLRNPLWLLCHCAVQGASGTQHWHPLCAHKQAADKAMRLVKPDAHQGHVRGRGMEQAVL